MNTLNKKEKIDKISFELNDEVKEILYKELKEAQNISSQYYLSEKAFYSIYHYKLDKYFKSKNIILAKNNVMYCLIFLCENVLFLN